MRLRRLLSIVVVVLGVASAGHGLSSPGGGSSDAIVLEDLIISGPATVAPRSAATFSAIGRLPDGTTRDVTARASWRSSNSSILCVSARGTATGAASGDVQIIASVSGVTAKSDVLVTPAGTFRLSGTIFESERPVAGATVAVIAGPGLGLSTISNGAGAYVLYDVSGAVEIQVTKGGYTPLIKAATLTRSTVLDFPDFTRDVRVGVKSPRN